MEEGKIQRISNKQKKLKPFSLNYSLLVPEKPIIQKIHKQIKTEFFEWKDFPKNFKIYQKNK
jgi:hypothetical protein